MINVFQPELGREELDAVARVFASNWIGKGSVTDRFEADFAAHLGVDRMHASTVSCCTEGLFQSMALLGVGRGHEVVLPAISFVGAANAVAAAGATPVFCDVDPRTLNATADSIGDKLSGRTRAVILLHYGGLPCELDPICSLLSERGIALVEDSACSVASTYKGRACGTFGDVGLWSFDSMKIVVTGDGGMIYFRDPAMRERSGPLLHLGLTSTSGFSSGAKERWWEFDVSEFARRAIMNDIASAIGVEQLKKLPAFMDRRRRVQCRYDQAFADLNWLRTPPPMSAYMTSSNYLYWVQTGRGVRDALAVHLRERGVYSTFRYYPLHRVRRYGSPVDLPAADCAADTTLCLPMHHSLTDADVETVIAAVRAFDPAA